MRIAIGIDYLERDTNRSVNDRLVWVLVAAGPRVRVGGNAWRGLSKEIFRLWWQAVSYR